MNTFLNGLQDATNFTYTENGAVTHKSTNSKVLDMFSLGGAYRSRSEDDCVVLFKEALKENEIYALKCLFYLRDILEGQGERRFFRVCMKWLAETYPRIARRNMKYIVEFGRWDDLYLFIDTPLQDDALQLMKEQLIKDTQTDTPSLLAKWLKSENSSSRETRRLGNITRQYFGMTHKQYRKVLSILRERINVLERLMSAGEWDKIQYDKIPSIAGLRYKDAFMRHDVERVQAGAQSYADFAKDENTTVNAKTLYPYDCVHEALKYYSALDRNSTERLMINKYWDNLEDYFNGASFNGMAVVDTSGSMYGRPIEVAISLGLYCADKAQGPFANHFITFSRRPNLVETQGVDFYDKVRRMQTADWGMNTNIEAVFDLLLTTAIKNKCSQDEIPQNLVIISDMEFDQCATSNSSNSEWYYYDDIIDPATLMETVEEKWNKAGYKMPNLVFWNVDARQNNIPMKVKNGVSFVSGFSPVLFEQIMQGKTAMDLCMEKLNSDRYSCIK